MATVKKTNEVKEELPALGGSFTRNQDGGLKRKEWTEHPSADTAPEKQVQGARDKVQEKTNLNPEP